MCKQFYVDTLDISHAFIDIALNARKPFTRITDNDQRGKHENRPSRIPAAVIYDIKSHIYSFPELSHTTAERVQLRNTLEQILI